MSAKMNGRRSGVEPDSAAAIPRANAILHGAASGSIGILARASSQIGMLVVTLFSTRLLAIEEFGAFAIASSLMALSRNMFYVGSYEYLLKSPESNTLYGSCLATNALFAMTSFVCLGLFGLIAPALFGTHLVATLVFMLSPSIFIAAITAWFEARMLRRNLVGDYYTVMLIAEAVGAASAIALLFIGAGVFALLAQIYGRLIIMTILYARRGLPQNWTQFRMSEVRHIVRWSWSRYVSVALNFVSAYGADLILGALVSPAASGLYRASNRIVSSLSDLFAQPIQKISQASISARTAHNLKPGVHWLSFFSGVAPIAWGVLGGLGCFAGFVIPLVLGAKWAAAAPIVAVFCVARALIVLDATTSPLLVCFNQQRFMLAVQIATAIAALGMTFVLAELGPFAVAVGTAVIMLSSSLTFARRAAWLTNIPLSTVAEVFARAALPALAAVAVVITLKVAAPALPFANLAVTIEMLAGFAVGLTMLYLDRDRIALAIRIMGTRGDLLD